MTPDEPLQFDTTAPAGTPSATCAVCKKPVGDAYYTAGKAIVCGTCKTQIETAPRPRATAPLVMRAIAFGLGGAILGAAVYYGVMAVTGLEIGLVAIVVGYLVGRGVQMGARGRRGRAFQITALVLTYFGIALGYAPAAVKALQSSDHSVLSAAKTDTAATSSATKKPVTTVEFVEALGLLVAGVLALPFVVIFGSGAGGVLTAIIIAVGLRQAWYMNRDPGKPVFHGPFRVSATA
jgi:hypothetical protein